jgi:DNA polymerase-1
MLECPKMPIWIGITGTLYEPRRSWPVKTKAVFIVGVLDECARTSGDYLSEASMNLLAEIEEATGLEGHVVFAVFDKKFAGREKLVKLGDRKDPKPGDILYERPRVIEEIAAINPDYVFCLGPTALSCVNARGSLTLDAFRRDSFRVDDIGCDIYVLDGLSRVAAQSGIRKWLVLDAVAAVKGLNGTEWGEYHVLQPDTPEWRNCPEKLTNLPPETMVGFDLETYPGLDPHAEDARIRMAMFSVEPGEAWVVQCPPDSSLPNWAEGLLRDPTLIKCGSNIAFDYKWCRWAGYEVNNMWDTSVAEHILDENDPNTGLKFLTFKYLPRLGDYSREHRDLVKERGGWEHVRDDEQYLYAGADAEASVAAGLSQLALIRESGLARPCRLAMDLYPVLADMQARGACVAESVVRELDSAYGVHLSELRKRITRVLGPINPASPPQLAEALVKYVPGINLSKRILTQWWQGRWADDAEEVSTQRSILERESGKHPVIADVLEFRRWNKLHGTYIKGVLEKHLVEHDGNHFIHASFNQNRVETHRLSSSNPNLQNIPRKPGEGDPPELNVKQMFVSRFEGGKIMEADFSQAELRVAAMQSGDPALTAAIESDRDVHTETAATLLGKDYDDITEDERQRCKTLNFLILYGGGANTLAKQLGIQKQEAKDLIAGYFRAFPRLKAHIDEVHAHVREHLEVESPFGFKRHFVSPPPKGDGGDPWNQWEGWRVQRQAFNMIIQNTAACITFVAIVEIAARMRFHKFKSVMFGTVHDSILFDIFPGEEERLIQLVREVMENPPTERYGVQLTVPMEVDIEIGTSWGNKKKVVDEKF